VAPDATMIGPNPAGVAGHSGERVNGTVPAGAGGLTAPFNSAIDPPPDFYQFWKTMETLNGSLDEKSWLILSTDSELLKYLKESGGR
jgi:hypothetical protein